MTCGPLQRSSTSYQPSAELMDAVGNQILEQNLEQKPFIKNSPQRLKDSWQMPQYKPSAELTNAINSLHQQSTASEDEQKPIPYPLPQNKRKNMDGRHSATKKIKLEEA